jgi:hypothetical protein
MTSVAVSVYPNSSSTVNKHVTVVGIPTSNLYNDATANAANVLLHPGFIW